MARRPFSDGCRGDEQLVRQLPALLRQHRPDLMEGESYTARRRASRAGAATMPRRSSRSTPTSAPGFGTGMPMACVAPPRGGAALCPCPAGAALRQAPGGGNGATGGRSHRWWGSGGRTDGMGGAGAGGVRQNCNLSCPNHSIPAVLHSSSAAPKGMSWICLRPSLISNSSPGFRPSWAV